MNGAHLAAWILGLAVLYVSYRIAVRIDARRPDRRG